MAPPFPKSVDELVQRLKDLGINAYNSDPDSILDSEPTPESGPSPKSKNCVDTKSTVAHEKKMPNSWKDREVRTLIDLCNSLIKVYVYESVGAVRDILPLIPFATFTVCPGLLKKLQDGSQLLDDGVLDTFHALLLCPRVREELKHALGSTLLCFAERLGDAVSTVNDPEIYRLICSLATVLDTLNDVKRSGISDERVVQPLLQSLDRIRRHNDLHLSQVARYAYQSLIGIPSDVSPWEKLGKNFFNVTLSAAKVASAMPNPVAGLRVLKNVTDLVDSITDLVKTLGSASQDGVRRRKPAMWYIALRYTNMLIRSNAPKHLELLLQSSGLPCRNDKEFLCGVCAQLEQVRHDQSPNDAIIQALSRFLVQQANTTKHRRVQKWVQSVVDSTRFPCSQRRNRSGWFQLLGRRESRKYGTEIKYSKLSQFESYNRELFERGLENCTEAKLFCIDQEIRNKYSEPVTGCLTIERLDGGILPMDQCYINLAVLPDFDMKVKPDGKSSTDTTSSFTLLSHLKVQETATTTLHLSDLFEHCRPNRGDVLSENASPDRAKDQPDIMRVLIRGQAGMGKSTLCKKMIYEFIHNNMWTEKIDRVIWFPLRELQEEKDTSIGSLIIRRHFVEDNEADLRSETLGREIEKKSTRTLFILDGLDEVPTGATSPLITKLLNQPRVIITSRPYAISQARLYNLHREVETVGFYADQVKEYIKVIGKDMAEEIQQFTDSHPIIQGLARIPIKLDAICFSFTEKSAASKEMNDISTGVTTMTELYKGVEWALWCKDIPKLGIRGWDDKESEPELITKEIAQREGPKVGKIWLNRPLRALQHLAFKGLCDNIYEFGRDYWQPIFTPAGQSPLNAASLSFLRSSSAYTRHGQTYHFLHPTFQEFFAAQYFVEHWKSNTELDHPTLENITAAHFLRKEKYNARYDIMWRFVAGLLQDGPGKEQLCLFFKLVEKEPRDLFGPGHQRLVMHCLNEVHPSQTNHESFHKMRMALENHLKEWLLYECRVLGKSWLAAESEFPCSVVLSAFREAPPESKAIIVKTMGQRRSIPLEVVSLLMALAKDNTDRQLCRSACDAIYSSRVQPTYELLRLTVDRLGTDSISTTILDRQVSLPKEITDAVSKSLVNPDLKMRNSAANALRGLESDAIIEAIARQLHNPDSSIRSLAIETLEREYSLPPFVLNEFYTKLKDTNEEVRTAASKALKRYRGVLPDNVAQAVAEHSKDPNDNATPPAAETPRKSPRLLEYLIQIFTKKDEHAGKEGGSVTFKSQKSGQEWTMGALQIIAKELEDSNPKIRISATKKLKLKTNLPEDIVQILAKQLEDSSATARDEAAEILSEQTALPLPLIQDLSQKLEGPNSRAWIPSLSALRKFVDIPDAIVGVAAEAITVHADRRDKKAKVRLSAAIKRNSCLGFPKAMLKQVAKSRDGPKRIAWWTLVTRRANVKLPEPVSRAVIKLLENSDGKTRLAVLRSLLGFDNFSVDLLAALTRIVEGDNVKERARALLVLSEPTTGPVVYTEGLLIALLKHFNSSDTNIWQKAMDAVLHQATLPTSVADAVAKFCEESATTDKLKHLVNAAGYRNDRRCPEFLQHTLVKLLDSPDREIRAVAAESFLDRPPLVQSVISTLFQKLLDTADATIRSNIGRAIEGNWISNENMETMIRVLQGSKSGEDVKGSARSLLLHGPLCRRELPETILQFLGKQLRDPDTTIRRGAALLLCERQHLSIPVIQTVVENLSYLSGIGRTGVPRVLVEMPLLDDKLLTSTFESLHQGPFTSLFVQLRKSSFQWHLTWCVDGDSVSYLNSAAGTRTLAFESLKTKVEEAQKKNSVPPSVNWVEDGTELEESARTERTSLISLSGLARCVVQ